jgi:allophanate hydrolase
LNADLTSRGARYLRTVATLPEYRLFALLGEDPRRPGLLRVGDGGHPIETEVWALGLEAFGRFVAGIPEPLGIGTVRLSDGTSPKGFLVEAAATRAAEDISPYGGWRAFSRQRTA